MINNVFRIVFSDGGHPEGRGRAKPFLAKIKFEYFFNTHFPKMLKMFASYLFWYQINFE